MQRLNHHHLYIFWLFGHNLSFTKTASILRIAQSAVTTQIKGLEQSLDLTLVDRALPRRPKLTAEGHRVLEYADSIFETSRELINWASKGELPKNRTLRMGAISGLSRNPQFEFLKPLLGNPEIKIEVLTGDQRRLLEKLSHHELDVVLTSSNAIHDQASPFHVNVLLQSPVIFVRNRKLRIRNQDLQQILASHDLYIPGRSFEARPELDSFLHQLKVKPRIAGEIEDIALLRLLALKGNAIVAIPKMGVINEIDAQELVVIGSARKIEQRFYAITRQILKSSDDVQILIDTLRRSSS